MFVQLFAIVIILQTLLALNGTGGSEDYKEANGKAIKAAVGVYKPETGKIFKDAILATVVNYEYLSFYHNFKCFADRLGYKFLVYACDEKSYKYLQADGANVALYDLNQGSIMKEDNLATFDEASWNKITYVKKIVALEILKLGYDVIFSDMDVWIVEDPMPLFIEGKKTFDYMHQANSMCGVPWSFYSNYEGNTGFYFTRSNPVTIDTWERFLLSLDHKANHTHDQTLFWSFLRLKEHSGLMVPAGVCPQARVPATPEIAPPSPESQKRRNLNRMSMNKFTPPRMKSLFFPFFVPPQPGTQLRSCVLDNCQFPVAAPSTWAKFLPVLQSRKGPASTLYLGHINYVKGQYVKMNFTATQGYWLATKKTDGGWGGKCLDFKPKYVTVGKVKPGPRPPGSGKPRPKLPPLQAKPRMPHVRLP